MKQLQNSYKGNQTGNADVHITFEFYYRPQRFISGSLFTIPGLYNRRPQHKNAPNGS